MFFYVNYCTYLFLGTTPIHIVSGGPRLRLCVSPLCDNRGYSSVTGLKCDKNAHPDLCFLAAVRLAEVLYCHSAWVVTNFLPLLVSSFLLDNN